MMFVVEAFETVDALRDLGLDPLKVADAMDREVARMRPGSEGTMALVVGAGRVALVPRASLVSRLPRDLYALAQRRARSAGQFLLVVDFGHGARPRVSEADRRHVALMAEGLRAAVATGATGPDAA